MRHRLQFFWQMIGQEMAIFYLDIDPAPSISRDAHPGHGLKKSIPTIVRKFWKSYVCKWAQILEIICMQMGPNFGNHMYANGARFRSAYIPPGFDPSKTRIGPFVPHVRHCHGRGSRCQSGRFPKRGLPAESRKSIRIRSPGHFCQILSRRMAAILHTNREDLRKKGNQRHPMNPWRSDRERDADRYPTPFSSLVNVSPRAAASNATPPRTSLEIGSG